MTTINDAKELLKEGATDTPKDRIRNRAYDLFEHRGKAPGHDLEDWLRAERVAVEEELDIFDTIFEQLPSGCLVTDSSGRIVRVNHEAKRLLGVITRGAPAAEWPGRFGWHLPDRVTLCPAEKWLLSRSLKGESVVEELGFLENPSHPAGIWVRASSTPIINERGVGCGAVLLLRDVTELRKEQAQEVQLRLAQEVQRRMFPATPMVPGLEVAGAVHPADETGGDYLDFIAMPGGRLGVAVGDVSRHGLGSALIMALMRAYVRACAQIETDPGRILTQVNRLLFDDLDHTVQGDRWFATMLLVCVDSGNRSMVYGGAGHVPGLYMNRHGGIERILESAGLPLAIFPETTYASSEAIALESQQTIVLLTDGILEATAPDGSYFGMERAVEHVRSHREDSAAQIVETLHRAARTFAADVPQEDDMTSAAIKVKTPGPTPTAVENPFK